MDRDYHLPSVNSWVLKLSHLYNNSKRLQIFSLLTSRIPDIRFYRYFLRSGLWAWWARLAYYPRTPDYTLYSVAHVCWSEHSDSSFVYGFMSLDYGFGTMSVTTCHYSNDGLCNLLHYIISVFKT